MPDDATRVPADPPPAPSRDATAASPRGAASSPPAPPAPGFRIDGSRVMLAFFVGGYVFVFTGVAMSAGNNEFLFYALVLLALGVGVLWLDRRVGFSQPVLWGLALWGLLHMAGGNVPIPGEAEQSVGAPNAARNVLYNLRPAGFLPRYDQFVHAFGFFVATLACFEALRAAVGVRASPGAIDAARPRLRVGLGLAVLLACAGMGLGALNEVVEFVATLVLPNTNVGDYVNTGWDLVANALGAALAAVLVWARNRRENTHP